MLIEDVERFNEWWFTGKVRRDLAPPFKRYAFQRIVDSFGERQILLITGPRRVGKTTLMYQAIERLLQTVPSNRILYYSFDELPVSPKDVLEFYERRVLMKPFEEVDRVFVFFDEIQYVENWPAVVKKFYDLYPNLKFFLSGSSTLLLSKGASEKLAGRFFSLKLKPLTFQEFLELKGVKKAGGEIYSRRLEAYFHDYLRKSGFPEIADWDNESRIAEYIRNSVIDRVALRDIPLTFKTRDFALMENIIKLVFSTPGSMVNVNSLSQLWGKSKITISNYLKYLETSMLARALSNFRPSLLSTSRKLKKYYPATPSLIFALSRQNFEAETGAVLETYAVNALEAEYYFRHGKKEINILLKNDGLLPIEVKETVNDRDIAKFSKLIEYIKAKRGIIISLNQEMEKENIKVVPAYMIELLLSLRTP